MTPFLAVGAIVLVIAGMAYLNLQQQKKRTREVADFAARMGWPFEATPPLLPELTAVEPFSSGHSYMLRNGLTRSRDGQSAAVFDFYYVTGHGKNRHHHTQTVVRVPLAAGTAPFSVRPEHFGHRIAGVFGMQDIDFPEHPTFSTRYLLRGPDEVAIRRTFRPEVVAFFESIEGMGATSNGRDLFLWEKGLAPVGEIESRITMAMELKRRLEPQG